MSDNRTTVKANIVALNIPSVTNAKLNTMLNTYLADNLVFGADVVGTQSASTSNITCTFTGYDRINLTRLAGALNITVAGISDGERKFLLITKTAGQAVTFVGVTDLTPVTDYVTAASTVLYEIIRKGSNYYAIAWIENVKQATTTIKGILKTSTQALANALSNTEVALTPGVLEGAIENAVIGSWQTASLSSNFSHASGNNVKYRLLNNLNQVQIKGCLTYTAGTTTTSPFTLASGYRPQEIRGFIVAYANSATTPSDGGKFEFIIKTNGTLAIVSTQWSSYYYFIDIIFPID